MLQQDCQGREPLAAVAFYDEPLQPGLPEDRAARVFWLNTLETGL